MRSPTILDLVQAVTDVAPAHPEVAVWWYGRAGMGGAPQVMVVLEARDGAAPDAAGIGSELAYRLGTSGLTVRMHRGASEAHRLHRLLTTADGRAAAGHTKGS